MPTIKKRLAAAITDAIQTRKMVVPMNAIWREIHKEFSIGTRRENSLQLSLDDHRHLRDLLRKAAGFDPLTDSLCFETRLEAASTVVNEKWGGNAGAGRLVNVYRHSAPIATIRGECRVPQGCGLWLNSLDLVLSPSLSIVVVENLAAFLNIEEFNLPAEWQDALFVYRGHNDITAGSTDLLARVPEGTAVAVMSDYDAAGLRIALSTTSATGWLGPAPDAYLGTSNAELFEKQAKYLNGLRAEAPDGLRLVLSRLVQERIAFTQERMAATKAQLVFYSFDRQNA